MTNADQKLPTIREQTLEHIARHLGDRGSGPQIVGWLKSWGVPSSLIEYPNTKWRMVYSILSHYAHLLEKKDREMLFKIIGEMLHPLMFGGDKKAAERASEDFNKYLEYDGLVIDYSDEEKKYSIWKIGKLTDEDEWQALNEDLFIQEQEELEFLRKPENREKISTLRKMYQVLMNIAEVFCDNPSKPSHELNDAYVKTKKLIADAVRDLRLHASSEQRMHTLAHYCIPFNNLFTAEKEYTPDPLAIDLTGKKLNWDYIRPRMNATYGDIDELYRTVEGSDVLSKPDVQQALNDISLLLAKTKEENAKLTVAKQKASAPQIPVQKIEITAMPALRFKSEKQARSPTEKSKDAPDAFSVSVKDREIWVNGSLLSKPYAVSGNKEFFDYVYENADKSLTRDAMPDYAKEAVRGGKGFSKVLNELGFKGEILKAFFPERGKSALLFRKSILTEQLAKDGINIELLLQELRTAHTRNSPK